MVRSHHPSLRGFPAGGASHRHHGVFDHGSTIDGAGSKNRFRIANAVDGEGNPVDLRQIDFIRIQTGVNCTAGNGVGEISTEVCGVGCYRTVTRTE